MHRTPVRHTDTGDLSSSLRGTSGGRDLGEGQGRGYNRLRGERHYQVVMRQEGHQVHGQEYGKSPGMGSRGAGEGQGDHG